MSWRDVVSIHPAADLFPLLGADELVALGEDIKRNGLTSPIALKMENGKPILLDGRNRLDAMERVGLRVNLAWSRHSWRVSAQERIDDEWCSIVLNQVTVTIIWGDPVEYITSVNIHRRHLMAETKRDLIAKLLKEHPERSDRATAKLIGADHKTVTAVRRREEDVGSIPHVEKVVDTKGRQQPASKPPKPEAAINKAPEPRPTLTLSRIEPHETCIMRVRAMILDEWLPQIPQAQLVEFVGELYDEIDSIRAIIEKRTGPIKIEMRNAYRATSTKAEAVG
jgi:hypothetical protein